MTFYEVDFSSSHQRLRHIALQVRSRLSCLIRKGPSRWRLDVTIFLYRLDQERISPIVLLVIDV